MGTGIVNDGEYDCHYRPLYVIAHEIRANWRNPSAAALVYLNAMVTLKSVKDMYGMDTGETIVRYFLCNASMWRGETACRVKTELRRMVGE